MTRTAKALSSWLSPAWETGTGSVYPVHGESRLELRPDLDQIEALTSEREALWARIEKVSFLTLNEKRQAVGYAPLEEVEAAAGPDGDVPVVVAKYNPNQPRAPRGMSEGGQWVDAWGGLGTSVASGVGAPAKDERAKEEHVRVAQAGPVDLRLEDEHLGRHTTTRHVARPDDELLSIVSRDRHVGMTLTVARKRQGSFLTIEDANNFVNRVLEDYTEEVQAVAKGQKYEAEFIKRFGYVTGKEAFRPDADAEPYIRPTYEVYVHIETDSRSEKGYRVFRAFPMNYKPKQE